MLVEVSPENPEMAERRQKTPFVTSMTTLRVGAIWSQEWARMLPTCISRNVPLGSSGRGPHRTPMCSAIIANLEKRLINLLTHARFPPFFVANISVLILGANFLCHYALLMTPQPLLGPQGKFQHSWTILFPLFLRTCGSTHSSTRPKILQHHFITSSLSAT